MAKLALNKIIIFAWNYRYLWHISSLFQNFLYFSVVFHHLLKRIRLLFPFRYVHIFILLLLLCSILIWNLFWRSCFWLGFYLLDFIRESLLLNFKYFSLFTYFCTCIFMLFNSIRSKFSTTLSARHSIILIDFYRTLFRLLNRRSDLLFLLFSKSLSILSTRFVLLFKACRYDFYGSFLLCFFLQLLCLLFKWWRFVNFSLSS